VHVWGILGALASVDFLLYWRLLATDPISEPTAHEDGSDEANNLDDCLWLDAGAFELYNNKGSVCRLLLYWGYALSLPKFTTRGGTQ
jgi:hypothetical protein